jgi:hypothetical protein
LTNPNARDPEADGHQSQITAMNDSCQDSRRDRRVGAPITHGLIIDAPWIDLILGGRKTWELRSTRTSRPGRIALIRKGSGAIYGTVLLTCVIGPLSPVQLQANERRLAKAVSDTEARELTDRWPYAWELDEVEVLLRPVFYEHKSGAVIWAVLDSPTRRRLTRARNLLGRA